MEQGFGNGFETKPKIVEDDMVKKMEDKLNNSLTNNDYEEEFKEYENIKDSLMRVDLESEQRYISFDNMKLRNEVGSERFDKLEDSLKSKIVDFIEKENLFIYGNHDHLQYEDEEFWGHYISPIINGVIVTVYKKDELKDNGDRGEAYGIHIELSKEEEDKMFEKIRKHIDLIEKEKENGLHDSFQTADQLEDLIYDRESGYQDILPEDASKKYEDIKG